MGRKAANPTAMCVPMQQSYMFSHVPQNLKCNKKNVDLNENGNGAYQSLWDTEKAELIRKFTAINTSIKKVDFN